ncbi:ROK family protein [Ktedonobacteria bacterium brp13]|nr:ROK family protein [Ktedonobacteria bacterium brp13]
MECEDKPFMNQNSHDFVLAVDFGGTKIAIATATLTGNILEQTRLDTYASQGAQQLLERTIAAARVLIAQTETKETGHCVAVGVVTPGVVQDDGILLSPNIPGWEQVALCQTMSTGLGCHRIHSKKRKGKQNSTSRRTKRIEISEYRTIIILITFTESTNCTIIERKGLSFPNRQVERNIE